MGTETQRFHVTMLVRHCHIVKLNNPQMGTETRYWLRKHCLLSLVSS